MIKIKHLVLSICIILMMACGQEGEMERLVYNKEYSDDVTYSIQFTSEIDRVTVSFNLKGKEIKVRGLKYKYLIKFNEIESISYRGIGTSGMFTIKTSRDANEIGIINEVDFDNVAKEMKTRSVDLRFQKF